MNFNGGWNTKNELKLFTLLTETIASKTYKLNLKVSRFGYVIFISTNFSSFISSEMYKDSSTPSTFLNVDELIKLRLNLSNYIKLIDSFAPCIVPGKVWKQLQRNFANNGTDDMFTENFTISDEAFLLVVLLSYEAKWRADTYNADDTNLKVRKFCSILFFICLLILSQLLANTTIQTSENIDSLNMVRKCYKFFLLLTKFLHYFFQKSKYTFSRINKNRDAEGFNGVGWSNAGLQKYNDLYRQVYEDRMRRGGDFIVEFKNYMTKTYGNINLSEKNDHSKKVYRVRPINDLQFDPSTQES